MQSLIEIKNLKHSYIDTDGNEIHALNGVSLDIYKGEFLAVIGANGSGKSTLGAPFECPAFAERKASVLWQAWILRTIKIYGIYASMSVWFFKILTTRLLRQLLRRMCLGPENIGVPPAEIRTRVDNALAAVGMTEYAKHAPHLLSGGQKQRVAIAGVLALEPDCIVLDEPTAMLDPRGRIEIVNTVKKLNREKNITVVYITHYMEEAMQADRIIAMEHGVIKMQGKPEEIFTKVKELHALGLETPLAAQAAFDLRQKGIKLADGIISNEELTEELCR